jgi:hypothetical protein
VSDAVTLGQVRGAIAYWTRHPDDIEDSKAIIAELERIAKKLEGS